MNLLSIEKENIVQVLENIYPEDSRVEYSELFNFWAEFIIYLDKLDNMTYITTQDVDPFIENYINDTNKKNHLIYLEWSINQRYPYATEKLRSWIGINKPYPLRNNMGKRIPSLTDFLIGSSDEITLKSHLLEPLNVIGTVIKVGKDFTATNDNDRNEVSIKTPVTISIQEVLGNQYKNATISGNMNAIKTSKDFVIKYQYYPVVGDTVFAKIWIRKINKTSNSGKKLIIDSILDIHQITHKTIIKNHTNIGDNEIAGLSNKTSIDNYKLYWESMFNAIIMGRNQ